MSSQRWNGSSQSYPLPLSPVHQFNNPLIRSEVMALPFQLNASNHSRGSLPTLQRPLFISNLREIDQKYHFSRKRFILERASSQWLAWGRRVCDSNENQISSFLIEMVSFSRMLAFSKGSRFGMSERNGEGGEWRRWMKEENSWIKSMLRRNSTKELGFVRLFIESIWMFVEDDFLATMFRWKFDASMRLN